MKTKKKKNKNLKQQSRLAHISQLEMTLKDIKREVIIRGMPFQEVVESDVPTLYAWWNQNRNNDIDESLLDQYDDWLEDTLRSIGQEDLIHSSFRFNQVSEKSEESKPKKEKVVKEKRERVKREKNSLGLFSGTKKAMVFEAQGKGWSLKKTIRKVIRAFPDAKEKSIKIWYKQADKRNGKKG